MEHGIERNRTEVTEVFGNADFTMPDGSKINMPTGAHTYTQSERFCRNCGWVTCKGILGAILCPDCNETW